MSFNIIPKPFQPLFGSRMTGQDAGSETHLGFALSDEVQAVVQFGAQPDFTGVLVCLVFILPGTEHGDKVQRQLHEELKEPDLDDKEPGNDGSKPADDGDKTDNLQDQCDIAVNSYDQIPERTHGAGQQGGVSIPVLDVPHFMC